MNKKYIDFIPQTTKRAEASSSSRTAQKMPAVGAKSNRTPLSAVMSSGTVSKRRTGTRVSRAPKKALATSATRTVSARRTARAAATTRAKSGKTEARASLAGRATLATPASEAKPKTSTHSNKVPEKTPARAETTNSASPFINTENLDKRPLSGAKAQLSAVLKPITEARKTEPGKIITMTEQPEPGSRLNFAIAVVLTVILGAAFGTVAFLLLPK